MTFVLWLHEYDPAQRSRVGGKNASLDELLAAGLPVPPGFAVTVDAYQTVREHPEVRQAVGRLLGQVDLGDTTALEEISAAIRGQIEQVPLHEGVAEAVRSAYDALCERCASEAVAVAVRSSATSEDLPDAQLRRRARHLPVGTRFRPGPAAPQPLLNLGWISRSRSTRRPSGCTPAASTGP
jgi:pyruvate,water dikinase